MNHVPLGKYYEDAIMGAMKRDSHCGEPMVHLTSPHKDWTCKNGCILVEIERSCVDLRT